MPRLPLSVRSAGFIASDGIADVYLEVLDRYLVECIVCETSDFVIDEVRHGGWSSKVRWSSVLLTAFVEDTALPDGHHFTHVCITVRNMTAGPRVFDATVIGASAP